MTDIRNIVILTGAGISAESGLATFRGPDGLWEGHRVEDVCTPEALARNPALVHRFYDERRAKLAEVVPNPAHEALAALDRAFALMRSVGRLTAVPLTDAWARRELRVVARDFDALPVTSRLLVEHLTAPRQAPTPATVATPELAPQH